MNVTKNEERTVQVPVSLIERIDSAYNASADTLAALIEQLWMLSKPNPPITPSSIADMAPGTKEPTA
jgi:hypothetical protein